MSPRVDRAEAWLAALFLLGAALVFLATFAGCATSRATFEEVLADGSTTRFETVTRATLGSRLREGQGEMAYASADWSLAVGQRAQDLQAGGDVNQLVRDLGGMAAVMLQLVQILQATPAPPAAEGTP